MGAIAVKSCVFFFDKVCDIVFKLCLDILFRHLNNLFGYFNACLQCIAVNDRTYDLGDHGFNVVNPDELRGSIGNLGYESTLGGYVSYCIVREAGLFAVNLGNVDGNSLFFSLELVSVSCKVNCLNGSVSLYDNVTAPNLKEGNDSVLVVGGAIGGNDLNLACYVVVMYYVIGCVDYKICANAVGADNDFLRLCLTVVGYARVPVVVPASKPFVVVIAVSVPV